MSEFLEALALPSLTAADGTEHQATRWPRFKDGRALMQALASAQATKAKDGRLDGALMVAMQEAANAILLGMGFPEAVVDDLDAGSAMGYASRFFMASLEVRPGQSPTSTTA